jgi:hypothetical protein
LAFSIVVVAALRTVGELLEEELVASGGAIVGEDVAARVAALCDCDASGAAA